MSLPTVGEAVEELGLDWPRDNKLGCPACGSGDNTPALHLYDDHFYCFSCGKHGDGIGLVALYTGQNVRTLVAQRSKGEGRAIRVSTKEMSRQGVNRAVYRQWQELHNWWFRLVSEIYKGAQLWAFEQALDLWSDVFDDLQDRIRGHNGYDKPLVPFEAEKAINELKAQLVRAEPLERRFAQETRLR